MTLFDYWVLVVIGVSVLLGLMRGMLREVFALASWIVAFLVARAFAAPAALYMPSGIDSPSLRVLAAFLALFVLAFIAMTIISVLLAGVLKKLGFGAADRGLGVLFGMIRGLAIVMIMVLIAGMTALPREPTWRNALSSGWFESLALAVKPWLPKEIARRIQYSGADA